MKKKSMVLCCFLVFLLNTSFVRGQEAETIKQVSEQFRHLQDVYKNAGSLSYAMQYTYANESTPNIILDSLSGDVEINGSNYRFTVDSTETISNGRYSIMLFKKDRVMYLAKPQKKQAAFNVLDMLDSTLSSIKGLQCSSTLNNTERIITLLFPAKMEYKEIQFAEDTVTGYIRHVKYIVKTNQLLDPQIAKSGQALNGYDEYAIVDMKLFNYSKTTADGSFFNENTFFRKEGKEYKTTEAYKDYKIFLGTPNL